MAVKRAQIEYIAPVKKQLKMPEVWLNGMRSTSAVAAVSFAVKSKFLVSCSSLWSLVCAKVAEYIRINSLAIFCLRNFATISCVNGKHKNDIG